MRGDDPSERDGRVAHAHRLRRQPDRGRHRGDPVQAVEHGEHRQAEHLRIERLRQPEEREPAQAVVPEEELAGVEAIGEPAAGRGAHQVEDAHHREQPRGAHLGDAMVHARRDQVRAHQPVGGRSTNEEAARQEPEVALARALAQDADRIRDRVLPRRRKRRRVRGGAVGQQPQIGGPIAHQQRHQREQQRDD